MIYYYYPKKSLITSYFQSLFWAKANYPLFSPNLFKLPIQRAILQTGCQTQFSFLLQMSTINQEHGDMADKMSVRTNQSYQSSTIAQLGWLNRLKFYLSVEVTASHADILLLICCIISGLVDSTIYNAFGTFVSMQTVIKPPSSCTLNHFSPPCVFQFLIATIGQHDLPWPRRLNSL